MARGQMARQPSRDSTDANTPARGGPFSHEHACRHRSDVGAEKEASEGEYDDGARFVGERASGGARNQPGTLAYEWYISPDGGTVHVVETYADSAAVVAHHVSEGFEFKNWAGRFVDCVDVTRVTAYGDPNAAAREILDRLGATYHAGWGGFARF